MKQNKTGNQYLNEHPGPTTRIHDKYDKGESKEDEISKSFPNFMALTEKEKLAFFEALSAARRNVEKSGNPSRQRFGTVHDEYLLYFNNKEEEKNLKEEEDEISIGEDDTLVNDSERSNDKKYSEKSSELETDGTSKDISERSIDDSENSGYFENRNSKEKINDNKMRKTKTIARGSKTKEGEREEKNTKNVYMQRERETYKFNHAVKATEGDFYEESSECVNREMTVTPSTSESVVTVNLNKDIDDFSPLNESYTTERTLNSSSTDPQYTSNLPSIASVPEVESPSKQSLLDECESILKKDTDTIINKYLKKKKKREKELYVKTENSVESSESQIFSSNKSKCVIMMSQSKTPSEQYTETSQSCRSEKDSVQKYNIETFIPSNLTSTPRFDALNEKEKEIFFNTLKEAHQKILEKNPEKKDEIIPFDAIFKGYNKAANATNVYTSITKEMLLDDVKPTHKEGDKNLLVKVTVTGAENRVRREVEPEEEEEEEEEECIDCEEEPAPRKPRPKKKVENLGEKEEKEIVVEECDDEAKKKLKKQEQMLREKELWLQEMERRLKEKEKELYNSDNVKNTWKTAPVDSRERLLHTKGEPESGFAIHRDVSLMDVKTKKGEVSGTTTIVFRRCPKPEDDPKTKKKTKTKVLKKKLEEEKIQRRLEEQELLRERIRKRKEEEEIDDLKRRREEEERKKEEGIEKRQKRKMAEEERMRQKKEEEPLGNKTEAKFEPKKELTKEEEEKRKMASLEENKQSATRGFLELLEVISIDLTPHMKEVDKIEMVDAPTERKRVINPFRDRRELILGYETESQKNISIDGSECSEESPSDKEDDDYEDDDDDKSCKDVRSAVTITKEKSEFSSLTVENLEQEGLDKKKSSFDFVTDRPSIIDDKDETELGGVISGKQENEVLVNDDVIYKIRRLIEDLERKAKAEEDYTRNEYAQLLQDYMNYLNRVLQSLVEQKNKKKQIHVQTSFTAAEVHLKFKDKEHKRTKESTPHSSSKEDVTKHTDREEDDSDNHIGRKSSFLIHESDSGSSLDSEIWEDLGGPIYTKKQTLPNTKIRLLQDLLKDRAEFVEGSINQFKIVHKSAESFVPTKTEKIEVELNNEEYEVLEKSKKFIRFFTAIGRFCHCVKAEAVIEDEVLENLKGEAVPVVVSSGKKNPASATLNNSTMEVLEAAKRKKIIQKYWQHQKT